MSDILLLIEKVLLEQSMLNELNLSSSTCRRDLAEKIAKKITRLQ